jgi:hypothetical protein
VGDNNAIVMGVCRCSFPGIAAHALSETCCGCCDDGSEWDGCVKCGECGRGANTGVVLQFSVIHSESENGF